ncbi:MAG TPA: sugar phosphate isomerase/epimerase [Candidatus Hydrogenedentes bacterium]|nr:sugar phosphate isomerase/epimerase [Candidatus Hydrogenedentota bacterium]HNT88432.1 sugar phosphate isomerase/epimerase [Candidatus Hydrogenedentota bacterium]
MARFDLSRLGAQSYSFRKFDFAGALRCIAELGLREIEFCAVHFPADASDPAFPGILASLRAANVTVPCYGVEAFTADAAANRKKFEFGKALGVECLTADPTADAFDSLDALCEEFEIKIAIHNHGPGARYDKVEDTLRAVEGRHPFIGACVDTGHAIRSGEKPHEVIAALGPRVHSLHLKDWVHGGEEQRVGEGDLDLAATARALQEIGFAGPIVFEYELDELDPVPGMQVGIENWRAAVAGL